MNWRRKKGLKPCPLCGTPVTAVMPVKGVWNIGCGIEDDDSDSCGLVLFGGTLKEVTKKWNSRVEETDR